MKTSTSTVAASVKCPTGISGFDDMTGGGVPRGRTTLLIGGPGSGKTIFALQFLAHGADTGEPGIFVAFEESADRIVANAQGFGWGVEQADSDTIFFLDAQPTPDLVQLGDFDLGGMIATLDEKVVSMDAKRIVFDALDIVLALLPNAAARRREVYRLHEWLLTRGLTGIITAKATVDNAEMATSGPFAFMQFMVDCAVTLNQSVVLGVSQRDLRVLKFRGSAYDENESPFLIGSTGIEVAVARSLGRKDADVTTERVSSGVDRLDTMLGGGYYRGASTLITGFPGTAKTTLSGAFAEAACLRGERTMFVSFDSDGSEVVRNLLSVGIVLDRFVQKGILRMISARTMTGSAETYLVRIKTLAREHGARCLVIDPVSTLSKSGNEQTAHNVVERLMDWSKAEGITLVCTSLDEMASEQEGGSPLQLATLADTWIHLNYLVQAGERNRGMSIIKSRGTAHSNQVRELILTDEGVTLADTYTAGGEVLMGTMRWEKESAERAAKEVNEVARKLKMVRLEAEQAELAVRVESLQIELEAKKVERELLIRTTKTDEEELVGGRSRMRELRGADAAKPASAPR